MYRTNEQAIIDKFTSAILELINNQEDYTQSDLQAVVEAIVINIILESEQELKNNLATKNH